MIGRKLKAINIAKINQLKTVCDVATKPTNDSQTIFSMGIFSDNKQVQARIEFRTFVVQGIDFIVRLSGHSRQIHSRIIKQPTNQIENESEKDEKKTYPADSWKRVDEQEKRGKD